MTSQVVQIARQLTGHICQARAQRIEYSETVLVTVLQNI